MCTYMYEITMVFPQGNIAAKDLQARPMELYMCSVLKRQGYGEGKFCSNGLHMQYVEIHWLAVIQLKPFHS